MSGPPTGTVTFLFTDIESSTRLWEQDAPAMQKALARHDEILRDVIEWHGGYVFKMVGDAAFAAFPNALDALEAALCAQRALSAEVWSEEIDALRVRMALHTGAAEERGGDYVGPPLNRVARLLSAGHGGQTLLSLATQELVRDGLPDGAKLEDLGEWRLKDLFRPERIFQLVARDLPQEFPPLRTLESRRNNLPLQPTPLVGREREVGGVCERLRQEEVRLLTLTGPGGTGKTRLSLQVGADLLEDFEHGVFFVELAAVTDPNLFFSEVAGALGLRESGDTPLPDLLKEYLRRRELLLILDNFEQLLEAARLARELLSSAPRVKVLATSRIPLDVYGEHEYAVPPLSVPDPKRLPSVETLSQYEAVRLFIERAGAAQAGFAITSENAPAIAEICARLDGLPLAIELAAARTKLLPPKALLTRLGNRLKLLTGGAKDLPTRQRTLRGAIEWSHDLLDEGEKTLFRRLAVFSGGRTLEAVDAICDAEGDLPGDALDGVSSLVDKSLLRREEGPEDEPRFVMLETIHEYAREKLEESGEAVETKRLHAEYFLALAEEAEPELVGPDQVGWMVRLEAEHDNMTTALSWCMEAGEAESALRMAGALGWFWNVRGHLSEGRRWCEEALARDGGSADSVRAKAFLGLTRLARSQGDLERAEASCEGSLALYRELGDDRGVAYTLTELGQIKMYQGDDRAEPLMHEALELHRKMENARGTEDVLNQLALLAYDAGDRERAIALWEEAMDSARERGDVRQRSIILNNLGWTMVLHGDHERGAPLLEESLAAANKLGDRQGVAVPLINLGMVEMQRGHHGRAETLLREGLILNRELGDKINIIEALEHLAGVSGARGQAERAARLYGAAEILRESLEAPLLPAERSFYERHLAVARSESDEAVWEDARKQGRGMTLDEAVHYALDEVTEARA